jgi:hypothetical protein
LPLTIGLGTSDRVRSVTIHWPDGSKQIIRDVQVDRSYEIRQQTEPAAMDGHGSASRQGSAAARTNQEKQSGDKSPHSTSPSTKEIPDGNFCILFDSRRRSQNAVDGETQWPVA